MNESQVINALSALSHEVRLRIIRHLVIKGDDGDSAGEIGASVDAAPSKVTFHISALERAGLVSSEKVSRQIIYRIDFSQMGLLLDYLMHDCCRGHAKVMSCCGVSGSEIKHD